MQISQLTPYKYEDLAVGKFPWSDHKYRKEVQASQITIPQLLFARLNQDNSVGIQMKGETMASLSSKHTVSNSYNRGPFMDVLSYSLTCKEKGLMIGDSVGGTPIEEYQKSLQEGHSIGVSPRIKQGYGGPLGGVIDGGLNVNYLYSKTSSFQFKETEYKPELFEEGEKKTLFINLKTCYSDSGYPISYDPNKMSTLRMSDMDKRLGIGIGIPFFGWFGGWQLFPDKLYNPPSCATSSIAANWTVNYDLPKDKNVQFEWQTEVRTVFASNNDGVPTTNHVKEYVNWVKTVHQIKQVFEVCVDSKEKKVSTSLVSRDIKKLCTTGYEETTTRRILFPHAEEKSISELEALKLFNIQD